MSDDLLSFLARWALLHELADDAWRGAVIRGGAAETGATRGGRDTFLDGLAALVATEKEALRERLLESGGSGVDHEAGLREVLEEVRYELGEIRGRLESLETAVDGLKRRLEVDGAMQS